MLTHARTVANLIHLRPCRGSMLLADFFIIPVFSVGAERTPGEAAVSSDTVVRVMFPFWRLGPFLLPQSGVARGPPTPRNIGPETTIIKNDLEVSNGSNI